MLTTFNRDSNVKTRLERQITTLAASNHDANNVKIAIDANNFKPQRELQSYKKKRSRYFTPHLKRLVFPFPHLSRRAARPTKATRKPCNKGKETRVIHRLAASTPVTPTNIMQHHFHDHHFYFPAQLVGGFTLIDLLDKPWSQVSSLPPGTCLQPLSRIRFSLPTARRLTSNVANSRSRASR